MKCRSVVGIWPETLPSHHVTAVTVINEPPSLYTGAADGSIFWWHFSSDSSSSPAKIKPVAMLCGHAAPIVDLCLCYPLLAPSDKNLEHERDEEINCSVGDQAALVSACSDGVLCLWSRGSGHCRRQRKLPPWAGSPSKVQMLPSNKRYVCVASCFSEGLHASDHDCLDSAEASETPGDQGLFSKNASKYTIFIVDSYTLTIVKTIFHGHFSIGPLKYMTIVDSVDDKQKNSALVIDSHGKTQFIPLVQNSNMDKEGGTKLPDDSSLTKTTTLNMGNGEGGLVVHVASYGLILGLVYDTHCVIMLLPSITVIGVIPFKNKHPDTGDCTLSHVVGGMFISSYNSCGSQSGNTFSSSFDIDFIVWDDRAFAIIYKISIVDNTFKYEVICDIPARACSLDVKSSTKFLQLNCYILRVESLCLNGEEPLLWRPRISVWSLHQHVDNNKNLSNTCKVLGESDFLNDGINGSSGVLESEPSEQTSCEEVTSRDGTYKGDLKYISVQKEHIVSSSMVISQNAYYPYAIVYGYHSGDIEVVQFNVWTQKSEEGLTVSPDMESLTSKQLLSGHTGPVLCLAALHKFLLSGSMDCTLRVWDLDTGNPIMVMHHHLGPVRQIVLPPPQIDRPWNDCFLSIGEDSCVALVSLSTLRAERMFPGHPSYPRQVIWDSVRGYLVCLCHNNSVSSTSKDVLYIWDIKAGSRERVLRGTAAHSMFSNFRKSTSIDKISGCSYNTSNALSDLPLTVDGSSFPSKLKSNHPITYNEVNLLDHSHGSGNHGNVPIRCYSPNSGIAILSFDLSSLLSLDAGSDRWLGHTNDVFKVVTSNSESVAKNTSGQGTSPEIMEESQCVDLVKLCLLRFSLSLLHLWGVDSELDNMLMREMNIKRDENLMFAPGLEGDRESVTLAFPAYSSTLQLWKSSSEFCALRSLIMVSLAQTMVKLSNSCSGSSSALSAFYTRHFAEKVPDMKPPSLQLLVSFWQDEDEHVRMAARSLFHCAASRAIPTPLYCPRTTDQTDMASTVTQMHGRNPEFEDNTAISANSLLPEKPAHNPGTSREGESAIIKWMESYELQDWISCVGGTTEDAMASHIIVGAALAIWYPSIVKTTLATSVVHPLIKLVMAMNEKYSSTAAELLAEGMDCTWKACLGAEIHRLIEDVFFQIECVSGASPKSPNHSSVVNAAPPKLRETLVGVLLPSLAMGDIPGFLSVIEGLIWSTASDSPVHLVSLKTIIRLMRGSPRNLAQYLNKVVHFILQTIDPANSVMRRTCLQSSMATLREVVRVYPMVALNDTSTQLAVGDAISEVNCASIHVYDMQSVTKIKVLDASGPPGLPTLLSGASESIIAAVSALSFSPDDEGLVAFSEHGLIIRWWSLGSAWWEKLSRSFVPVRCTKLIFVPPWEGFSPNSSRASIMANIAGSSRPPNSQEHLHSGNLNSLNLLLYNLDLSYRLEWAGNRKVRLTKHGHEIDTFLM